eukprot:m.638369 g.638369  ORF g.638369 m.638369 type:complete len:162 (-) comp22604_c3_seq22:2408-2893(-)
MMRSATMAFTAVALVATTSTASAGDFTVLLQHDCHGNFQMMPSLEAALGKISTYGGLNKVYGLFRQRILDAADCRCPALSDRDVNLFFNYSLVGLMNAFNGDLNKTFVDTTCNTNATNFTGTLANIEVPGGAQLTSGLHNDATSKNMLLHCFWVSFKLFAF